MPKALLKTLKDIFYFLKIGNRLREIPKGLLVTLLPWKRHKSITGADGVGICHRGAALPLCHFATLALPRQTFQLRAFGQMSNGSQRLSARQIN